MKRFCTLLFLLLPACFGQQQWSIGYWNSISDPVMPVSAIDFRALTHVSHWAALVRSDGTLDIDYENIRADAPALVSAAHAAGVKAIFCIVNPYFLGQNGNIGNAVANHRAALVNNIMSVVNQYGYDGVSIDWEGSTPNIGPLAADLRARLGTKHLMADAVVSDYRYWGSVATYFDRINVMTYDLTGTWNPYSWHNAALYDSDGQVWSLNLAVQRFTANGVPASKLGVGIPFFGYQWTGGGVTAPRQTWSSEPSLSQINYKAFASQIPQRTYGWDSGARVPYLSASNSFLTYDNAQSIADKINFVKSNNLGGWIIWNLMNDYMPGQTPTNPLLAAVRDARGVTSTTTAPTITTASLAAGTVAAGYSQTLAATGTAPFTWAVTAGALPGGLSLGSSSGILSGTPAGAGSFTFTARASNTAGSNSKQFTITINPAPTQPPPNPVPNPGPGTYYLSDLQWISSTNGYGPIRRNLSTDGNPLALNGVTYNNGLGAHANSTVSFNLGGVCSTFAVSLGVDDEVGSSGSVQFQIWGDSSRLYQSKTLNGSSATQNISVSVAGRNQLRLVVDGTKNGIDFDHADWANARLTCSSAPGTPEPVGTTYYVSDVTPLSATNGWGPLKQNTSTDGATLSLRGVTFTKGLGAHANSQVVYKLNGACSTFQAEVGVDDETSGEGSAAFQVLADGASLYQSGVVTGSSPRQPVSVSVAGRQQLTLIASDGGDGIDWDHADWANARLTCTAPPQ